MQKFVGVVEEFRVDLEEGCFFFFKLVLQSCIHIN